MHKFNLDALLAGTAFEVPAFTPLLAPSRPDKPDSAATNDQTAAAPTARTGPAKPAAARSVSAAPHRKSVKFSLKLRRPGPAYSSPDAAPYSATTSPLRARPQSQPQDTECAERYRSPSEKLLRASTRSSPSRQYDRTHHSPTPQPKTYPGIVPVSVAPSQALQAARQQRQAGIRTLSPLRAQMAVACAAGAVDAVTEAHVAARAASPQAARPVVRPSISPPRFSPPHTQHLSATATATAPVVAAHAAYAAASSSPPRSLSPPSPHAAHTHNLAVSRSQAHSHIQSQSHTTSAACSTASPAVEKGGGGGGSYVLQPLAGEASFAFEAAQAAAAAGAPDTTAQPQATSPSHSHGQGQQQSHESAAQLPADSGCVQPFYPPGVSSGSPRGQSPVHTEHHYPDYNRPSVLMARRSPRQDAQQGLSAPATQEATVTSVEPSFEAVHVLLASLQLPDATATPTRPATSTTPARAAIPHTSPQRRSPTPQLYQTSPTQQAHAHSMQPVASTAQQGYESSLQPVASPVRPHHGAPGSPGRAAWMSPQRHITATHTTPNPAPEILARAAQITAAAGSAARAADAAASPGPPSAAGASKAHVVSSQRVGVCLGGGLSAEELVQRAAREAAMGCRLDLTQALCVLELQPGALSEVSGSRVGGYGAAGTGGEHMGVEDDSEDPYDLFSAHTRALPVRLLRLKALRAVATEQDKLIRRTRVQLAAEMKKEKRLMWLHRALDVGTKMGMSKMQLKRLRAKVPDAGDPSVNAALQAGAVSRVLLRAAFAVLLQRLAWTQQLRLMLDHTDTTVSAVHLPALLAAWRHWAQQRAIVRRIIKQHHCHGLVTRAHAMLVIWHAFTQYRRGLRETVRDMQSTHARRTLRKCFVWWRAYAGYKHTLSSAHARIARTRLHRWWRQWRHGVGAVVRRRRLALLSAALYVRRLLTAALAHWRTLVLHRYSKRVWYRALDAWRVARIRGLVLERWHFMARRAAQIIARAGKYKHLPGLHLATCAPVRLDALPTLRTNILDTARALIETAQDELYHLRRHFFHTYPHQPTHTAQCGPEVHMGVDNRQVGDVWAGLLPGPRQPEPAGLLTALLRAAADERRPRKKPSIPAQTQQPTSAPATGHTDVQADIAGLGVDTGGDMPSTTFTYMSLIEGLEGLYESQGLGSEGVCEQEAVCAELPGRQPLLINQWQYKHEVIDLLTQLHACESERRECQGIVDTELLGLDQLKAAIQERTAALKVQLQQQTDRLKELETLQREAEDKAQALAQERQEASQSLTRHQSELAVVAVTLSQLRDKRQDAATMRQRLQTAHADAQAALQKAVWDLEQAESDLPIAESAEFGRREHLLLAQQRLSDALGVSAELHKTVRELAAQVQSSPNWQVQRRTKTLQAAEERRDEAQHVVALAQTEVSRQESLLRECEAAVASAKQRCVAGRALLEASRQEAVLAARRLQQSDVTGQVQCPALDNEIALLDTKHADMQQGLAELTARIVDLATQAESAREIAAATLTQCRVLASEVQETETQLSHLADEERSLACLASLRSLPQQHAATSLSAHILQLQHTLTHYPLELVRAVAAQLDARGGGAAAADSAMGRQHTGVDVYSRPVGARGLPLHLLRPVSKGDVGCWGSGSVEDGGVVSPRRRRKSLGERPVALSPPRPPRRRKQQRMVSGARSPRRSPSPPWIPPGIADRPPSPAGAGYAGSRSPSRTASPTHWQYSPRPYHADAAAAPLAVSMPHTAHSEAHLLGGTEAAAGQDLSLGTRLSALAAAAQRANLPPLSLSDLSSIWSEAPTPAHTQPSRPQPQTNHHDQHPDPHTHARSPASQQQPYIQHVARVPTQLPPQLQHHRAHDHRAVGNSPLLDMHLDDVSTTTDSSILPAHAHASHVLRGGSGAKAHGAIGPGVGLSHAQGVPTWVFESDRWEDDDGGCGEDAYGESWSVGIGSGGNGGRIRAVYGSRANTRGAPLHPAQWSGTLRTYTRDVPPQGSASAGQGGVSRGLGGEQGQRLNCQAPTAHGGDRGTPATAGADAVGAEQTDATSHTHATPHTHDINTNTNTGLHASIDSPTAGTATWESTCKGGKVGHRDPSTVVDGEHTPVGGEEQATLSLTEQQQLLPQVTPVFLPHRVRVSDPGGMDTGRGLHAPVAAHGSLDVCAQRPAHAGRDTQGLHHTGKAAHKGSVARLDRRVLRADALRYLYTLSTGHIEPPRTTDSEHNGHGASVYDAEGVWFGTSVAEEGWEGITGRGRVLGGLGGDVEGAVWDSLGVAAAVHWAHRRMIRVLRGWRSLMLQAKARARIARHRYPLVVQQWALSRWQDAVCHTAALCEQLSCLALCRRYLHTWRVWMARERLLQSLLTEHAAKCRQALLRKSLTGFRLNVLRQAVKAQCTARAEWSRLQRSLRTWRVKASARALLRRVFCVCDQLWDERGDPDTATYFNTEYTILQEVFARWTDYVASKKARRHTKVQESTAYVHWSTRLLVRCLACWEMAVRERWHAHRVHRVCRRALREWRDVAEEARRDPHGRANMRRRLRRLGYASESAVHDKHLLTRALLGWAGPTALALHHWTARETGRCVQAWKEDTARGKELRLGHIARWRPAHLRAAWSHWQQGLAHNRRKRAKTIAVATWHSRRTQRSALRSWVAHARLRATAARGSAIAVVHRAGVLRHRAWTALRTHRQAADIQITVQTHPTHQVVYKGIQGMGASPEVSVAQGCVGTGQTWPVRVGAWPPAASSGTWTLADLATRSTSVPSVGGVGNLPHSMGGSQGGGCVRVARHATTCGQSAADIAPRPADTAPVRTAAPTIAPTQAPVVDQHTTPNPPVHTDGQKTAAAKETAMVGGLVGAVVGGPEPVTAVAKQVATDTGLGSGHDKGGGQEQGGVEQKRVVSKHSWDPDTGRYLAGEWRRLWVIRGVLRAWYDTTHALAASPRGYAAAAPSTPELPRAGGRRTPPGKAGRKAVIISTHRKAAMPSQSVASRGSRAPVTVALAAGRPRVQLAAIATHAQPAPVPARPTRVARKKRKPRASPTTTKVAISQGLAASHADLLVQQGSRNTHAAASITAPTAAAAARAASPGRGPSQTALASVQGAASGKQSLVMQGQGTAAQGSVLSQAGQVFGGWQTWGTQRIYPAHATHMFTAAGSAAAVAAALPSTTVAAVQQPSQGQAMASTQVAPVAPAPLVGLATRCWPPPMPQPAPATSATQPPAAAYAPGLHVRLQGNGGVCGPAYTFCAPQPSTTRTFISTCQSSSVATASTEALLQRLAALRTADSTPQGTSVTTVTPLAGTGVGAATTVTTATSGAVTSATHVDSSASFAVREALRQEGYSMDAITKRDVARWIVKGERDSSGSSGVRKEGLGLVWQQGDVDGVRAPLPGSQSTISFPALPALRL